MGLEVGGSRLASGEQIRLAGHLPCKDVADLRDWEELSRSTALG